MPHFKNEIINGMKKCNICEEIKRVSEFYIYKGHPRGHCKKCNYKMGIAARENLTDEKKKEYNKSSWKNADKKKKYQQAKERYIKTKQKSVDYLGGKCSKCGYEKCIEALEFHHIDPTTKDYDLSKGRGIDTRKNFKTLKIELDKCILLCANCHREEHYEQKCKNINSL